MTGAAAAGEMAARLDALEHIIGDLRDREEIRNVIYSYVHGTDRCDRDLIADAYHADAWDDHGSFSGDRDTVSDLIASNSGGALNSQHHVGNIFIELYDDVANVESYFISMQWRQIDGAFYTRARAGRYLDRFERRDAQWRIAHRAVVDDWARLDRVEEVPEIGPDCVWGLRSAEDRSYQLSDFRHMMRGNEPECGGVAG